MDESEFDRFADEYTSLHAANIKASGEDPEFFAEYKIADTAQLARDVGLKGPIDVLDFGAGVGNSIPFFRRYFPEAKLTCLDVSKKSLSVAAERFPSDASYVEFDGGTLPFPDASFDVIFSACVFHHISHEEHRAIFDEWYRVLRPRGLAIVFEHNPYNPLTVHAVNTCPFDENAVLISARQMVQRIAGAGFPDVTRRYRIFFPGALRKLRAIEPALMWMPLGAQYFVAARKT